MRAARIELFDAPAQGDEPLDAEWAVYQVGIGGVTGLEVITAHPRLLEFSVEHVDHRITMLYSGDYLVIGGTRERRI